MADQVYTLAPLTLVLGGQRSGKSVHAESLMSPYEGGVYVATGQASDDDMAQRIAAHQDRRGAGWVTMEEPLDLDKALMWAKKDHPNKPVLIDSLGMWVSNMLHAGQAPMLDIERVALNMFNHPAPVVVVSDEVGSGVIPMNKIARSFVDALGIVNQITADQAPHVVLVVAGLPQTLKAD